METIKSAIQARYGEAARQATREAGAAACCGGACGAAPTASTDYTDEQRAQLPEAAVHASLGCGNPTALADLAPGQTVLDLGSGGGIDVLLAARRVGAQGKVFGLDMTGDMLALARKNQRQAGAANVEFIEGEIERIPLPDASVDVIISNCVINLSADKDRVFAESFRVLRPGGRFAVSDVVARGDVPQHIRDDVDAWTGCVAGALDEQDYRERLARAGFSNIEVELWQPYDVGGGRFSSAFVRATKDPVRTSA